MEELNKCTLCPFECKVNRNNGELGRCKVENNIKIGLHSLYFDEEPCISGKEGSGAIFFSNCNLKCKYCQNYKISAEGKGKEISIEELSNIFIEEQEKGANNINLITAVPYVLHIIEAIKLARKKGLHIPIVYNTSGYESIKTLKILEGYIDIYLPDFKYYYNDLAFRLSKVNNYREVTQKAILEMYRQVGKNEYDDREILKKGMIIRHLVLPNNIQNSKNVLKWIKENLPEDIMVSLMAQYFPTYKAKEDEMINRKLTKKEYEEVENYLFDLDIENGYVQDLDDTEEQEASYVPKF